ncbi:MAG: SemiSWEET transporter [Elusimicrobiota bacterium]|jgi:MtN3 and saliva related transmembrane protein|nr:SemiSWEET transporter [Elusimicrobiota bacterium]
MIEVLGFIAGIFSSISFIPQVYKTWKTKSARDVSMQMFLVYELAVVLWIIYGIAKESAPIYITNGFVFFVSSIQITLKIIYDKKSAK